MPMVVLRTRLEEALVHGYQLRSQLLFGAPLRARRAKIGKTYRAGLVHRLGLLPTIQIDAPARTPASILEELRRWRPDCIDVRPGVLDPLTEEAERQGRGDWPWRWIVCGGEVLYPDLLERAERAFGARILERYGAHEAGQIAWRCLDCGCMHTNDDSVVVEVEKDGRTALPGETGEVLVTSLLSFAMPFIRLRLGDLAERGSDQNPCRFGFARIGSVQGRRIDNLALADGRSIPAYGLMAAVRRAAGVRRFQIIQESFDEVRVLYVPADGSSADLGGEVERLLRPALPAAMNITAECVSDIPLAESGKYRSVRSLPAQPRPSSHTPK
jgi:phenylacetate-CoA ligase